MAKPFHDLNCSNKWKKFNMQHVSSLIDNKLWEILNRLLRPYFPANYSTNNSSFPKDNYHNECPKSEYASLPKKRGKTSLSVTPPPTQWFTLGPLSTDPQIHRSCTGPSGNSPPRSHLPFVLVLPLVPNTIVCLNFSLCFVSLTAIGPAAFARTTSLDENIFMPCLARQMYDLYSRSTFSSLELFEVVPGPRNDI